MAAETGFVAQRENFFFLVFLHCLLLFLIQRSFLICRRQASVVGLSLSSSGSCHSMLSVAVANDHMWYVVLSESISEETNGISLVLNVSDLMMLVDYQSRIRVIYLLSSMACYIRIAQITI